MKYEYKIFVDKVFNDVNIIDNDNKLKNLNLFLRFLNISDLEEILKNLKVVLESDDSYYFSKEYFELFSNKNFSDTIVDFGDIPYKCRISTNSFVDILNEYIPMKKNVFAAELESILEFEQYNISSEETIVK